MAVLAGAEVDLRPEPEPAVMAGAETLQGLRGETAAQLLATVRVAVLLWVLLV